jgi:hypothetical protein
MSESTNRGVPVRWRSVENQHRQTLQHLLWLQRKQVSQRDGRKFPLAQRKVVAHEEFKPGESKQTTQSRQDSNTAARHSHKKR